MRITKSIRLLFCAIGLYGTSLAQDIEDANKLKTDFTDKGLQFTKGDNFLLNFRFRTQLRAGYYSRTDDVDEHGFEGMVRRFRLRFEGHLLSPKLEYKLQLSFSKRDMDLDSGDPQIVRDAVFYYNPNKYWSLGLGQTKLPGNRERVNSSGELQMPDRSIANSKFTLDRDFGIFINRQIAIQKQVIQLQTAISTGDGRGQVSVDKGLAYTGRIEYLPFGEFKNKGHYFEGDLEFEETPKLSLGLTYSKNFRANRTGGQLGKHMYSTYDEEEALYANIRTIIADAMFKYNGWAFMGEYFDRKVDDFSVKDFSDRPDDLVTFLKMPAGKAINIQGSKMVSKKDEIAIRYTQIKPHKEVALYQYRMATKAIGYSHYFNKHKIKLQGYLGLDDRMGDSDELDDPFKNRVNGMIQLEIGI